MDENQTMPLQGNWTMWGQTNWVIASKDAYCELWEINVRHVHGCHAWSAAHKSTSLQRMPDKDCSGASLAVLGQQKGGRLSCELMNHDTHSSVRKNVFDSCVYMRKRSNEILRVYHLGYGIVRADSSRKDLVHRSWWRLRCISAGKSILYSSSDRSFSGKMEENSRPDLTVARGKHA